MLMYVEISHARRHRYDSEAVSTLMTLTFGLAMQSQGVFVWQPRGYSANVCLLLAILAAKSGRVSVRYLQPGLSVCHAVMP